MKICITSQGNDLDSLADPKFGRCEYFLFIDPSTMEYEAIKNEGKTGEHGVGVQAGQLVAEKGAEIVLTGSVGPNAARVLESAGIKVEPNISGTIKDIIKTYQG